MGQKLPDFPSSTDDRQNTPLRIEADHTQFLLKLVKTHSLSRTILFRILLRTFHTSSDRLFRATNSQNYHHKSKQKSTEPHFPHTGRAFRFSLPPATMDGLFQRELLLAAARWFCSSSRCCFSAAATRGKKCEKVRRKRHTLLFCFCSL